MLLAGCALTIGGAAAPAFAQADAAAASNLAAENERLRQEVAALRAQLAQAPLTETTQAAAAATPAASTPAPAASSATRVAQTDGGEILVTGRVVGAALRDLKDVPKPVSVVTQAELRIFDQVTLQDALSRLGNVRFNDGNPRTGSFSMRGITAGAGSDTIDPSIGLTVDGVPYAYLALAVGTDLVDIDQINVTRGPQGTTGARHTSVGQINITTRRPSFDLEGSASLTLGNYNALRAEFAVGGPIIDDILAFRITATRDQRDGAYVNDYPDLRGLQTYGNLDRTFGRAQLLFTPSSDISIRLLYDKQPNGSEYVNGLTFLKPTPDLYANGAPVDKTNDTVAKLSRRWFAQQKAYVPTDIYRYPAYLDSNRAITTGGEGGLIDASWTLGKQTLSLLSSIRSHYFLAANDDGTPFDIAKSGGFITTYRQFTAEAKLTGELGDGLVNYVGGLFYLKNRTNSLNRSRQGNDSGAFNANVAEYNALDANSSGRELLVNSLARLYRGDQLYVRAESRSAFAQADWHVADPLTLTTGVRISRETRRLNEGISLLDEGYGAALNPVNVGAVQLGGFGSTGFAAANAGTLLPGQTAAQLSLADAVALQYFGVAATGTPGGAYNSLTAAQRRQVAGAKAIRLRTISTLFPQTEAQPWIGTIYSGQASLRYEFDPNFMAYATVQYGQKPGIAQFNGLVPGSSGAPRNLPAKKERTISYEAGVRTSWLDGDLILNANLYRQDIRDFQQTVFFYDDLLTTLNNNGTLFYSSGVGNAGRVRTQGVEADFVFSGLKYTTFRFSGAYSDAKYLDFKFAGQPIENSNLTQQFRDVTGFTLQNAPKIQFNVTGDYRRPVFGNMQFHASAGYTYTSSENGDATLSSYAFRRPYGIVDAAIGIGRLDGRFDINFIVRNLLDEARGDPGWNSFTVYQRRRSIAAAIGSKF